LQDPSTYSVSGTTLTFSAAPPAGTGNISVRFLGIPASGVVNTAYRTQTEFTATAGQTTFSVPSYTVGYIDVYRNGALLGSADFTATNGTTVVLAAGASSGDLVETVSFFVSSVLNAIPATNGAVTSAYLLDASVTQAKLAAGVAGNGPAFSAWLGGGNQSLTIATWTKITFNTEEFDTNSCYNTSTYRFTPNVAGYYQVNLIAYQAAGGTTALTTSIYKNGSAFKTNQLIVSTYQNVVTTALIYLNGSTDYIEAYANSTGATGSIISSTEYTYFQASLVRSA
jgi:hypothetical protein